MSARHRHPQTSDLQRENERLRRELANKDRQLQRQAEQIAEQRERIADAEKQIADAEKQIADLERQLALRKAEFYELFQAALLRWSGRRTAPAGPTPEESAEGGWTTRPPRSASAVIPAEKVDEIRPILPEECRHCGHALPHRSNQCKLLGYHSGIR